MKLPSAAIAILAAFAASVGLNAFLFWQNAQWKEAFFKQAGTTAEVEMLFKELKADTSYEHMLTLSQNLFGNSAKEVRSNKGDRFIFGSNKGDRFIFGGVLGEVNAENKSVPFFRSLFFVLFLFKSDTFCFRSGKTRFSLKVALRARKIRINYERRFTKQSRLVSKNC